jgi:L-fuconolactonase
MQIIDTHVHAWNIQEVEYAWLKGNTSILNRTNNLDELEPKRQEMGITGGIMVQAANNLEDTQAMLRECRKRDWLLGLVGWIDFLNGEKFESQLADYEKEPFVKGFRHLIHDEPNPEWLLQPEVIENFRKLEKTRLTFDVVSVLPRHLECVLKLSEKFPDQKWVLDHLSHPPAKTKERLGKWGELMKAASQNPNIYIKISGLGMCTADLQKWEASDIQPYVEFSLEHFGVERAMMGGDWPVVDLCGGYQKSWKAYKEILNSCISESEQKLVFKESAKKFYNL